jgi:hypothetical protein
MLTKPEHSKQYKYNYPPKAKTAQKHLLLNQVEVLGADTG